MLFIQYLKEYEEASKKYNHSMLAINSKNLSQLIDFIILPWLNTNKVFFQKKD